MYPDHSLMPKEAIRLCALGLLAEGERRYAELADEVRAFVSHVMGPNLDLMGSSIQMLCYEGLAAAPDAGRDAGSHGLKPDAVLAITDAGRAALGELLMAAVRAPFDDLNKLVLALKMRFFGRLGPAERRVQVDLVIAALENEAARLAALRDKRAAEAPAGDALVAWLEHDLAHIEDSLDWFARLGDGA